MLINFKLIHTIFDQRPMYGPPTTVIQTAAPTIVVQTAPSVKRAWNHGLFGCFASPGECCFATFCPALYLFKIYAAAGEGCCSCIWGGVAILRTKVRSERGIDVSFDCCFFDFFFACFLTLIVFLILVFLIGKHLWRCVGNSLLSLLRHDSDRSRTQRVQADRLKEAKQTKNQTRTIKQI